MLEMIWQDLITDGYSKWFALGFFLSVTVLVVDIVRNGWTIEEDAE